MRRFYKKNTKNDIAKILRTRKLENIPNLHIIESTIRQQRGYVFRMPKPGTPVILLFSGGLDTTVFLDILLRQYKLEVYPIFIHRGQRRTAKEERVVNYFTNYYRQRFPNLHPISIVTAHVPPTEIREVITANSENTFISKQLDQRRGNPLILSHLAGNALHYATYLEITQGIKIRTIFCGTMPIDGVTFSYESLTSLRSIMQSLMIQTNDNTWQFTSLALETEMGAFYEKDTLIRYAQKYKIPIELTWSCIHKKRFHCGDCLTCNTRKNFFVRSGISDKTIYRNESRRKIIKQCIQRIQQNLPLW